MNPLLSASAAILFVIIGMVAAWIMLEIHGNPGKKNRLRAWTVTHKTFGYLFILIYLGMVGFMIKKAGTYQMELSPRAILHIALGLFLAPAIGFKLLIVKRCRRFFAYLPVLGTLIFATAFVLTGLAAGYFFLHHTTISDESLSELDDTVRDKRLGWHLVQEKCSKCHSLERVLKANKSKSGWVETVVRMARKDAPHLRPFQAKQIVLYLSSPRDADGPAAAPAPKAETGEALVQTKCTTCHDLSRVYQVQKDLAEWRITVNRMVEDAEEMGELDFLTETEAQTIIRFLANPKK